MSASSFISASKLPVDGRSDRSPPPDLFSLDSLSTLRLVGRSGRSPATAATSTGAAVDTAAAAFGPRRSCSSRRNRSTSRSMCASGAQPPPTAAASSPVRPRSRPCSASDRQARRASSAGAISIDGTPGVTQTPRRQETRNVEL